VISARSHEHLGLVLEATKGLAMDDPVAVALKWGAQTAIWLGLETVSRI
jgi:hypothetical protein